MCFSYVSYFKKTAHGAFYQKTKTHFFSLKIIIIIFGLEIE